MKSQGRCYLDVYQELEIIGQGSFGSAHLIKHKRTGELQVAKKINLRNLSDKEKLQATREVEVLKSLNHPNIVQYKGSYLEDGQLIILMEYCEEGDLAYHITRRKRGKKVQYFPEGLILNWFIQLLFALEYIHLKKILHRDIKTNNIFLTSNGTVKIGDFGVSKVLENTLDHASTVAGTPYYMRYKVFPYISPEVCENKPYTFKSDVWALGCVLYELCTFNHAFDAKNLLGLIYKILKDQAETLPSHYSKNMQGLIHKLLSKQATFRPIISEIQNLPFIKQVMQEFVINGGKQSFCGVVGVKKTKQHEIQQHKEQQPASLLKYQDDDNEQQLPDFDDNTLQSQVFQVNEYQPMRIGQSIVSNNSNIKQSMKNSDIHSKYTIGDTIQSNNSMLRSKVQNTRIQQTVIQEDIPLDSNEQTLQSHSQFIPFEKELMQRSLVALKMKEAQKKEQQLKESQVENYSDDFEEYEDDFEEYEAESREEFQTIKEEIYGEDLDGTRLTAKQSDLELQNVVDVYRTELARQREDPDLEIIEETDSMNSSYYKTKQQFGPQVEIIRKLKESILQQLPYDLFTRAYSYLKLSRQNQILESEIQKELTKIVGKKYMNACFNIDQLIYRENSLNQLF